MAKSHQRIGWTEYSPKGRVRSITPLPVIATCSWTLMSHITHEVRAYAMARTDDHVLIWFLEPDETTPINLWVRSSDVREP